MPNQPSTWQGISLSIQGTSHRATGTGCQDASGCRIPSPQDQPPLAIAAAADGAGSSHHAAEAAQAAVNAVINHLAGTPEAATQRARDAVLKLAAESGQPVREYHTTLLLAHCLQDSISWAHTGDGAIVAINPQGMPELLSPPEQGSYANETRFITDPNPTENCRTGKMDNSAVAALCLFTDGLQRLVLDYSTGQPLPHPGFFNGLWKWLSAHPSPEEREEGLLKLLNSAKVRERTNDDVTLAILLKQPAKGP